MTAAEWLLEQSRIQKAKREEERRKCDEFFAYFEKKAVEDRARRLECLRNSFDPALN